MWLIDFIMFAKLARLLGTPESGQFFLMKALGICRGSHLGRCGVRLEFEIPPAIYRSALWGIPESALASAFGVLLGDSQQVPLGALPRVPGKLGVPQGVLPRVLFLVKECGKTLSGALPGALPISRALSGALPGALSGNPPKALRKHSPKHFRGFPINHSCKWRAGSQVLRMFRNILLYYML